MTHPPFDTHRQQVFVVGNEAADADSIVSAYALAALLDGAEVQGVPVAQIPREEVRLRGDVVELFRAAGSEVCPDGSPARMRFWDEVDWDVVRALQGRSVVLTDHNEMSDKVASVFSGRVKLILDHHANAGAHPDAEVEIVDGLGSTCTLVAERFRDGAVALTPEVGRLLAGVILLDTRNFDPAKGKTTPRDEAAFEALRAYLPEAGRKWYKELKRARKDVSHLAVGNLLKLDLKTAPVEGFEGRVAFASMMASMEEAVERAGGPAGMLESMLQLARERGYAAVVCLFSRGAHGLKAVACAADPPGVCDAIEARLRAAPADLPEALRASGLFASQGILEHGFGLAARPDLAPLRAFAMRPEITRKTLLPRAAAASPLA